MARPSRPDQARPATPADEVGLPVYAGETLEAAMAAARAARGADVRVVRARRVKAGVRGMLGQARYEVLVDPKSGTATPAAPSARPAATRPAAAPRKAPKRPAGAATGNPVADTLEALLEAAEDEERRHAEADPDPVGGSAIDDLLADMASRSPEPSRRPSGRLRTPAESPGGHPDLDIVDHEPSAILDPDPVPLAAQPRVIEGTPARVSAARRGRITRAKLRAIGIPSAILKRLPSEEPDSPGGWLDALYDVVRFVVPAPAGVSADAPVVISGYGLAGVLAMLEAGAAGIPPGELVVDGVAGPATADRMLEVISACVHS